MTKSKSLGYLLLRQWKWYKKLIVIQFRQAALNWRWEWQNDINNPFFFSVSSWPRGQFLKLKELKRTRYRQARDFTSWHMSAVSFDTFFPSIYYICQTINLLAIIQWLLFIEFLLCVVCFTKIFFRILTIFSPILQKMKSKSWSNQSTEVPYSRSSSWTKFLFCFVCLFCSIFSLGSFHSDFDKEMFRTWILK